MIDFRLGNFACHNQFSTLSIVCRFKRLGWQHCLCCIQVKLLNITIIKRLQEI